MSSLTEIVPPPTKTYASEDQAIAALYQWTLEHGFNVTKRRAFYTDKTKEFCWKRGFDCDCAGQPKNTRHLTDDERTRMMRGSKRGECPMKIIVKAVLKSKPTGEWAIVHTNRSRFHNHPPSADIRVHVGHPQRAAAATDLAPAASIQELVEAQTADGVSISRIRATLLQANPNSFVTPKDNANTRNSVRRRELSTQTGMEALFTSLEAEKFFYRYEIDPETYEIRYLFWAHSSTAVLYPRHPDVVVMDCTYKTNKYRLPLLNIVSVTGFNTVLPEAQCWLPGETEVDYFWALTTIQQFLSEKNISLPNVILTDRDLACMNAVDNIFIGIHAMICRWHMNKNVLSKAPTVLGQVPVKSPSPGQPKYENTWQTDAFMATFYAAVDSQTEAEFKTNCGELKKQSVVLSHYLGLHWWKYKERIVRVWTNNYHHFGVRDTSVVEGTHAKCKTWLRGCRGGLYTVYKALLPWWAAAVSDTLLTSTRNATITPFLLQGNRYVGVVRIITIHALKEASDMWKTASDIVYHRIQEDSCSGIFRTVHGRPCVHELIAIIKSNGSLRLLPQLHDRHWWIDRTQIGVLVPRIQEPSTRSSASATAGRRRRHVANTGIYGTRRDPVFYERVDRNHPSTPPQTFRNASFDDTSVGTTALTMLPPLQLANQRYLDDSAIFHHHFAPPRSWDFASLG